MTFKVLKMSLGMHPAEKAKKNQLVHLQRQNKRRIRQVGLRGGGGGIRVKCHVFVKLIISEKLSTPKMQ